MRKLKKLGWFILAFILFMVWFFYLSVALILFLIAGLLKLNKLDNLISKIERYLYFTFDRILEKHFYL